MSRPSRKQAVIFQAIGGYANTAISIIQGLLLIPMYLHYIGAHTYGLWLASGGILAWLSFVDLGIGAMMVQRIARAYGKKNLVRASAYFTSGMVMYSILAGTFVLLGYSASWWALPMISTGAESKLIEQCFQFAVLATAINLLNECLRAFAQAILRPVFAIVSLILGRLFGLALTIVLLILEYGLWAIPIGMGLTAVIVLLLNIANVYRIFRDLHVNLVVSKKILKEYLTLSPALFAGRLGTALVKEVEPLLITLASAKPEIATAYVVTKRAADIVSNMLSVIIASMAPSFSHLAGEKSVEEVAAIARLITFLIATLGLIGFGGYVALNHSFVSLWVGNQFSLDSSVTLLIALGGLVALISNCINRLLIGLGDIKRSSLLALAEAAIRVVLMYLLFSSIGIEGIPLAILISCTMLLGTLLQRIKRFIPVLFGWKVSLKYGLVFFIIFLVAILADIYLPLPSSWGMFVLQGVGGAIVLYAITAYLVPPLHRASIGRLLLKLRR